MKVLLAFHFLFLCVGITESGSVRTKRYAKVPIFQCRKPNYYACDESIYCIHSVYRCDGDFDCPEEDDEKDCYDYVCPEGTLKCSDTGQCISKNKICNGCMDCKNGDDERNCSHVGACLGSQFKCSVNGTCIPAMLTCDLAKDCPMAEDEHCRIEKVEIVTMGMGVMRYNLNYTVKRDVQAERAGFVQPILLKKWQVDRVEGWELFVRPLDVSLGSKCGPSLITIREYGKKVAELCADSFPPWHGGGIRAVGSSFEVEFRFFNDFEDAEERSFSLEFWIYSKEDMLGGSIG